MSVKYMYMHTCIMCVFVHECVGICLQVWLLLLCLCVCVDASACVHACMYVCFPSKPFFSYLFSSLDHPIFIQTPWPWHCEENIARCWQSSASAGLGGRNISRAQCIRWLHAPWEWHRCLQCIWNHRTLLLGHTALCQTSSRVRHGCGGGRGVGVGDVMEGREDWSIL